MFQIICSKCKSNNNIDSKFCNHCGNQLTVPTTPKQEKQDDVIKPNNITNIAIIFSLVIILLIMFSSDRDNSNNSNNSNNSKSDLVQSNKVDICRAAISLAYGKSIHIIKLDAVDPNGNVRVSYNRANDNSYWAYACDVSQDSLIYAGWLNDEQEWGRWRHDEKFDFNIAPNKSGSFTLKISENSVGTKTYNIGKNPEPPKGEQAIVDIDDSKVELINEMNQFQAVGKDILLGKVFNITSAKKQKIKDMKRICKVNMTLYDAREIVNYTIQEELYSLGGSPHHTTHFSPIFEGIFSALTKAEPENKKRGLQLVSEAAYNAIHSANDNPKEWKKNYNTFLNNDDSKVLLKQRSYILTSIAKINTNIQPENYSQAIQALLVMNCPTADILLGVLGKEKATKTTEYLKAMISSSQ